MQSIQTLLKLAQLRWTGQVTRMPDERLPKKVVYGELQVGKRLQCGQKKRYEDTLKASEQIAQDRANWRREQATMTRRESSKLKKSAKSTEPESESSSSELTFSICNKQFKPNKPSRNTPKHMNCKQLTKITVNFLNIRTPKILL